MPLSTWEDYDRGAVSFFRLSSGLWTECATIAGTGADFSNYSGFGARIFNLGNIDNDGADISEVAASAPTWSSGTIKFFGSFATKTIKKSIENFGYFVAAAGIWSVGATITDIAIGAPGARISGQYTAGKVMIFAQGNLSNAGEPTQELMGIPSSNANFGTNILARLGNTSSVHNVFSDNSNILIAAPLKSKENNAEVGSILWIGSTKLAAALPTRLSGNDSNLYFGRSIAGISDIDNDSVPDVLISQPGQRCQGARSGVLSVYSVGARKFVKDACPLINSNDIDLGALMMVGPTTGKIWAGKRSAGMMMGSSGISMLGYDASQIMVTPTGATYPPSIYAGQDSYFSTIQSFVESSGGQLEDFILIGDPNAQNGSVYVSKLGWSVGTQCYYRLNDGEINTKFGSSASFIADIDNDGYRDILIAAPEYQSVSAKGAVFLVPGKTVENGCHTWGAFLVTSPDKPTGPANILLRINADHPSILTATGGRAPYNGFGNYVVGLPDLDGAATGYDGFIYVANSNIRNGDSAVIPEFFILGYSHSSTSVTVIRHETGVAGSRLGSHVRILSKIDNDAVSEIAIACPGCQGRRGDTGQVRIFSGAKIVSDYPNSVIQMLYNPDSSQSNFGIAIEYTDITGDGIKDFIIGADKYSADGLVNAGAAYIFGIEAVK